MRKAAIGPIADDIPSIFPIVAGVVLFMSAVGFISQQLEARNDYLELRKAGTGLAYAALSKTYVGDDVFDSECKVTYREYAARRRVNFLITLKKFCHYIDLSPDVFSEKNPYLARPHASIDSQREFTPIAPGSTEKYHHLGISCYPAGGACNENDVCDAGENTQTCPIDCGPKDFQSFNFPAVVDCAPVAQGKKPLRGLGMMNVIVWRRE